MAVTVLFGIALAWYSFLVPMWRAPDERAHVDLVLDVAEDGSYPAWDANLYRSSVLTAAELVGVAVARSSLGRRVLVTVRGRTLPSGVP